MPEKEHIYTGLHQGISHAKAEEHLATYGLNTHLQAENERGRGASGIPGVVRVVLLWSSAVCAFLVGETWEGVLIVLLTALYIFYEVYKTRRIAELIRVSHEASAVNVLYRVVRSGEIAFVPKEHIVPDDIIILGEGENVPADAHIVESEKAFVDESAFRDEFDPNDADSGFVSAKVPGSDPKNIGLKSTCVYNGTRVVSGTLTARVFATGVDTRFSMRQAVENENAKNEKNTKNTKTTDKTMNVSRFEHAVQRVAPVFAICAAGVAVVSGILAVSGLVAESGTAQSVDDDVDNYIESSINSIAAATEKDPSPMDSNPIAVVAAALLPGFALALCLIPAETESAVRMYYAEEMSVLKKKHAAVKNIKTIEKLASLTTICVDKSALIMQDRIEIVGQQSRNVAILGNISVLSCDDPDSGDADIFDLSIISGAEKSGTNVTELRANTLLRTYPFSKTKNVGGNLWDVSGSRLLCVKGTPETIYALCGMSSEQLFAVQQKQEQYAAEGYQVIAVAFSQINAGEIPDSIYGQPYTFVGLLALINLVKDEVASALRICSKAGVRVVMLTGDSPNAAAAIGKKIGLREGNVLTGDEFKLAKSESPNNGIYRGINIFAEIKDSDKADIIEALSGSGEIVAVIGNSPNDLPFLEKAQISVAHLDEAAPSVLEHADIVVSDDVLTTIAGAVREARCVHRNIKRAISLSVTALSTLILFGVINFFTSGGDFVFTAAGIALIGVATVPAAMMMFRGSRQEADSSRIEFVSSGFVGYGIVNRRFILTAIGQGISLFLAMMLLVLLMPEFQREVLFSCMLMVFSAGIVSAGAVNFFGKASKLRFFSSRNNFAMAIVFGTALSSILLLYIPVLNTALGAAVLEPLLLFVSLAAGVFSQLWLLLFKE